MANDETKCCECAGHGVTLRGDGISIEFRICSRLDEAGHPSRIEVLRIIGDERRRNYPASGRFS